jgi:LPXTG-motif cell wall-anchored protein
MNTGKANKAYLWLGISGIIIGLGLIFAIRNRRRIVKFSESLKGQTEIAGNAGFSNTEFQALMEQIGWQPGDAWCVYFVKLVWYNMAPDFLKQKILNNVTGSTWTTWNNLNHDPNFKVSAIPRTGDMAIWRMYSNGEPTLDGHAGIVKKLGFGNFTTVEGNTNTGGGTEGYIVAEKTRNIDYITNNGLRLVGFIRFA